MFKSKNILFFSLLILILMLVTVQPLINYLFYVILLVCLNLGNKKRFLLNPFFLLIPTILSISFYNSNFSSFLIDIPISIHLLIFFGMTSFLAGLILSDKSQIFRQKKATILYKKKNIKLFWIVLILGLLPHLIGFINQGFPILNLTEIKELRENYLPAGLSYFTFFLPLTIIVAFSLNNKKLKFISITLNALISIVKVSKFDVLIFSLFLLFSIIKYSKKNNKSFRKHITTLGSLALVPLIFNWFFSLRNLNSSQVINYLSPTLIEDDSVFLALSLPYLYLTSAWSNFTETVLTIDKFNYGIYTFYPFISALKIKDLFSYQSHKVIYQWPFNTHAFLTDYYMDFGLLGVLLMPFLIGIFVNYSYRKFMNDSDPLKDGKFLVLGIPVLMFFFSNHYTSVGYPFIVYILYSIFGLFSTMTFKIK